MSLIHSNCLEMPQPPILTSAYSTAGARQRARMNQQCLEAVLAWLQAEFNVPARIYPNSAALPSIWEVVNGTAIQFNGIRLVLIPTVTIAVDELRVAQEWLDIPDWTADYYISVQIEPEGCLLRLGGYATHQQLKTTGIYTEHDRTYAIEVDNLSQDNDSLWIACQLCLPPAAKATVAPLPHLPQAQANTLLNQLGQATVLFPRLDAPFERWGAILAHGGWRQRLYEQRQGLSDSGSIPQWIQSGMSNFARQLGWEQREFTLTGVGVRSLASGIARTLMIAGDRYELRVLPVGQVANHVWRVELRSAVPGRAIPVGFRLRLLTEDLQSMDNNEDIATVGVESLYIDVVLEPGEGLVWEIEPTPEAYDREILRF
jgi:hypothetical protein